MSEFATYNDAFREYAYNYGMDHPEVDWISTPWDVWVPNPHFVGERSPHPESYDE